MTPLRICEDDLAGSVMNSAAFVRTEAITAAETRELNDDPVDMLSHHDAGCLPDEPCLLRQPRGIGTNQSDGFVLSARREPQPWPNELASEYLGRGLDRTVLSLRYPKLLERRPSRLVVDRDPDHVWQSFQRCDVLRRPELPNGARTHAD